MTRIHKTAITGMLTAVCVALSPLSVPVGSARCFPIQHMMNVIAGVLLGPSYAVMMAFSASLLRNLLGTGTLLAFPGSMLGALLAGLGAKYTRGGLLPACAGELIGTGFLGALAAYPLAAFVMGREAALFAFVVPFALSSAGGAAIAFTLLLIITKRIPHKEGTQRLLP